MGDTPNIHLALAGDADEIRNWQILDAAILALGLRQVIPGNVLIQGDLEITGATTLDGTLSVAALTSLGILNVSNTATFSGALDANGALVVPTGPVTLPSQSIIQDFLQKGATVQAAAIGTANTSILALTATPQPVATVTVGAAEDPACWELVIAQATLRVGYGGGPTAPNGTATFTLRRGATDLQSRALFANATMPSGQALNMETPLTMVRLNKPLDTSNTYTLVASVVQNTGLTCWASFGQVYCLQFR